MTNTHINVGGHKITTSRLSNIHTCSISSSFTSASGVYYYIVGRMCWVIGSLIPTGSNYSNVQATTDLPKPVTLFYINVPGGAGDTVPRLVGVSDNGDGHGRLRFDSTVSKNVCYFSFSYPVADDWVES